MLFDDSKNNLANNLRDNRSDNLTLLISMTEISKFWSLIHKNRLIVEYRGSETFVKNFD